MAYLGAIASTYQYFSNQPIPNQRTAGVTTASYKTLHLSEISTGSADWLTSGTSASFKGTVKLNYGRLMPTWALDERGYFPNTWLAFLPGTVYNNSAIYNFTFPTVGIPIDGAISGVTREKDGTNPIVIAPYKQLALMYRPTGKIIMRTTSDSNGAYTFSGLEPTASKYVVIGLYSDGTEYDAVAHDSIAAI